MCDPVVHLGMCKLIFSHTVCIECLSEVGYQIMLSNCTARDELGNMEGPMGKNSE